jgi:alpha-tubulin suppressor-like RCC1 family protein
VPVIAPTNTNKVACGLYHTCLIDTSGNVWTCGLNNYGQLGLGNTTNTATPTQVSSYSMSDVQCGEYHSVFETTTGTVYAAGLNNVGQLGVGDNSIKTTPTQVYGVNGVGLLTNVKNIYCGRNDTFYTLTTNNNVYMSGSYKSTTANYPVIVASFKIINRIYCNKFSDEVYVKISS